ncbi:Rpn family recombination-promoting nuclease/putative transposase [Gordonia sp. (in: high G+C Gram-positive bacteria)]|uniref:Rpn family recombination-promoting nuclease/putative transposase n=1 Tax=Gordonia sp. (in: high G+C Gram-positive bacteria) TaxID=84139 RepID=UPI003526F86B
MDIGGRSSDDSAGQAHDALFRHVLMEHQRTPDPLMAFRMLSYQVQIWRRHLHEVRRRGLTPRPLPPIIPLVIYQGRRRWTPATDLAARRLPRHRIES